MFCFYAHEKNARFVSVRKIVDDFSAFKDREFSDSLQSTNDVVENSDWKLKSERQHFDFEGDKIKTEEVTMKLAVVKDVL